MNVRSLEAHHDTDSSPAIPFSIPARTNHESPFDYANRIFATELLREAHDAEHATLRTRHDQQIKELKAAVGALSKRERTTLLQRYQDLAGAELAELTKKLEEERAGTAFGFVLLIIIFGLVW